MKILIVDDQFTVLQSLKDAIEPSGHACTCFQNPVHALQNFTSEEYDVVITDYKMPQMNGIELLCSIQKHKPGVPVIMFTGYAEVNNIIDAVNFGVFAFYRKPVNIWEIMRTLDRIKNNIETQKKHEKELNILKNQNKIHFLEIQHRIRNNLQIISSLISMQINLVNSKENQNLLKSHENRIKVIGLSYEMLNDSRNLIVIDFDQYIKKLLQYLYLSFSPAANNINLLLHLDNVQIPIDQAIPIGLAINEIFSNTLMHAFPNNWSGKPQLTVTLKQIKDDVHIIIHDNGNGFTGIDPVTAKTMGFKLVYSLIINQLRGKVIFDRTNGVTFTFIVPIAKKENILVHPAFAVGITE